MSDNIIKVYELCPKDGRKSFYGKALVKEYEDRISLFSYHTKIMTLNGDGTYVRHYGESGVTSTTLRHIKAFCGMNKKEFLELEYKEEE